MAEVPREQLTRSPQINTVLQEVQGFCEGGAEPRFLVASAEAADRFVAHMQTVYRAQMAFRERTPLVEQQAGEIRRLFAEVREGLGKLKSPTPVAAEARKHAENVRAAYESLMGCFEVLQKEEETFPVYSRSPYMNLVMRVAHGWSRGRIAPDALHDAIQELLDAQRKFRGSLGQMRQKGAEAAILEQRRDDFHGSLARVEKGLADALAALGLQDVALVMASLKEACEGTERLLAIHDAIREAEEAGRYRSCFRCGAKNPKGSRHCSKCGGFMPPLAIDGDDTSMVDLQVEDQVRATGHVRTEMTQRLSDAVAAVQQQKMGVSAFEAVLDDTTRRLEGARKEFEKLGTPPDSTADEKAVLDQGAELLKSGMAEVEEGLREMRVFLIDGNLAHLDIGLEAALKGCDRMFVVQTAAQATKGANS